MTPPQGKRRKNVAHDIPGNVHPGRDYAFIACLSYYVSPIQDVLNNEERSSSVPSSTLVQQRVFSTGNSRNYALSAMSSAPRMTATPARLQSMEVKEQIDRQSPVDRKHIPPQATPNPRVPARIATLAFSRSVSRASEKRTYSFPAVALDVTDSDSENSSDESFRISKPSIVSMGRPRPLGQRAARKTRIQPATRIERRDTRNNSEGKSVSLIDSDLAFNEDGTDDEGDLYVDSDPVDIRNRTGTTSSGDQASTTHGTLEKGISDDPERALVEVLNALTTRETRLLARGQLPFLRRNLRKSMDSLGPSKWRGHDPDAVRSIAVTQVNVVYVVADHEYPGGSFYGRWFCPLCAISLCFNTRGALDTHLYRHHAQCAYEWSDGDDSSILLKITLPDVPELRSEDEGGEGTEVVQISTTSEEGSSSDDERVVDHTPPSEDKPFLHGPSVVRAPTIFSSSPSKAFPSSTISSPVHPFIMASAGSPAKPKILRPPRPIDPSDPDRYPTPPPLGDLEGPASVHPYISEDTYSDRPGGPKLYDILNELSLEPFGLMTGHVIEREEDVFELDNMRDEEKVMLALWSRWIFLNRRKFIEDYEAGIRAFLDEYWRIIHRAAGFTALRTWLLVLVQNRYLSGTQFCGALKYYKDLVGMDLWKVA